MDNTVKLAKDLLLNKKSISMVEASHTLKFTVNFSNIRKSKRFLNNLYKYLTTTAQSTRRKNFYYFELPNENKILIMEIMFFLRADRNIAKDRYKLFMDLINEGE